MHSSKMYEEMFMRTSQGLGDFMFLVKFVATEEADAAVTTLGLDLIVLLWKERIELLIPYFSNFSWNKTYMLF